MPNNLYVSINPSDSINKPVSKVPRDSGNINVLKGDPITSISNVSNITKPPYGNVPNVNVCNTSLVTNVSNVPIVSCEVGECDIDNKIMDDKLSNEELKTSHNVPVYSTAPTTETEQINPPNVPNIVGNDPTKMHISSSNGDSGVFNAKNLRFMYTNADQLPNKLNELEILF